MRIRVRYTHPLRELCLELVYLVQAGFLAVVAKQPAGLYDAPDSLFFFLIESVHDLGLLG